MDRVVIEERLGAPSTTGAVLSGVVVPLDPRSPATSQLRLLLSSSRTITRTAALVQGHIECSAAQMARVVNGESGGHLAFDPRVGVEAMLKV
jgi:hypothetical protein